VSRLDAALTAKAFFGLVNLLAVMAVALFLSAGTWRYGLGWIFLLEFFACALAVTISLIRHDPALLQRRVAAGPAAEGRTRQKVIQAIAGLAFLSIVVVPALDRRLGWSPVPAGRWCCSRALLWRWAPSGGRSYSSRSRPSSSGACSTRKSFS
jgi:hypothetical protein